MSTLTVEQEDIIREYVLADPVLSTYSNNIDGAYNIADALNSLNIPTFNIFHSLVDPEIIQNKIIWANFIPENPDDTVLYQNRALVCRLKLALVQTLLLVINFDATKINIVNGLEYGLTNIPSGIGNTEVSAGWEDVQTVLYRAATTAEKLLVKDAGNPAIPDWEGVLSPNDIMRIMRW